MLDLKFIRDNPDFPGGKEAGSRIVEDTLQAGLDLTSYNLERTWKNLKREGVIKPLTQEQITAAQNKGQGQESLSSEMRRTAPPSPGSTTRDVVTDGAGAESDMLDRFAQMSRPEREKILREKGLL